MNINIIYFKKSYIYILNDVLRYLCNKITLKFSL